MWVHQLEDTPLKSAQFHKKGAGVHVLTGKEGPQTSTPRTCILTTHSNMLDNSHEIIKSCSSNKESQGLFSQQLMLEEGVKRMRST